ncbi:hypothetical protein L7F22_051264 [Adiantum nelumboides]|nr:hypothetical protein [Adiantum nelumboides]
MDFNSPLRQEELHPPPPFVGSPPPPPSSSSSPHFLSSQASAGSASARVSKRKSRAVAKPPIRVLSADRETFRDLVQKLTGIPTSPLSLQAGRLWNISPSTALFRPLPARPRGYEISANVGNTGFLHQSMPTLDTSSAYLRRGFSNSSNLGFNEISNARLQNDYYGASYSGVEEAAAAGVAAEAAPFAEGDGMSDFDSFLMGSTKLEDLLQARIDPWLTPHVEIAHSA